jgi:hypothetical protein
VIGLTGGLRLAPRSRVFAEAPPVLTNATDVALGPTSGTIGVDLTGGDDAGNIFWVTLLTADSEPSAAQIEAGFKADGTTPAEDDGSQAVSGDGTQTITTKPTMLDPATGYKTAFVYKNGSGVFSNVIVGDGFTTTAIVIATAEGGGASTTNPTSLTGLSWVVKAGDAVVIAIVEQGAAPTATAVTDNLGHTYTAVDANGNSVGGTCAMMQFQTIVTVPGTITDINVAATASANDIALKAEAYNGPFSGLDAAPDIAQDSATPFESNLTGTLSQPSELVVGHVGANNNISTITATAPGTLAGATASGGTRRAAALYINTEATTSIRASFVGTSTGGLVGVMSFARAV